MLSEKRILSNSFEQKSGSILAQKQLQNSPIWISNKKYIYLNFQQQFNILLEYFLKYNIYFTNL